MNLDTHTSAVFCSAGITFLIEQGKVLCGNNEVRLTPINMKVLQTLIISSGDVVSRGSLFDAVWGTQQISDDSLTRSISDIRQQLKKLAPNITFIETIPKRGYRWNQDVATIQADPIQNNSKVSHDAIEKDDTELSISQNSIDGFSTVGPETVEHQSIQNQKNKLSMFLNIKIITLGAFIALCLFTALFYMMQNMLRPQNIVILLPIQSEPKLEMIASSLQETVSKQIIKGKDFKLLTQSVLRLGSSNHFHYLSQEYHARYAIEGFVSQQGPRDEVKVSLLLIDTKTATILKSQSILMGEMSLEGFVEQFLLLLNQ
jgi:DNA-binding winged helix-turn-helix (wHTH) protein/TolB-like protein